MSAQHIEQPVEQLEALRARLFVALTRAEDAWSEIVTIEGQLGELVGALKAGDNPAAELEVTS